MLKANAGIKKTDRLVYLLPGMTVTAHQTSSVSTNALDDCIHHQSCHGDPGRILITASKEKTGILSRQV
jgi:hypothetical protein